MRLDRTDFCLLNVSECRSNLSLQLFIILQSLEQGELAPDAVLLKGGQSGVIGTRGTLWGTRSLKRASTLDDSTL